MRTFLTTLLLVLPVFAFTQIRFEKGYIIDQNGSKTHCLIFNKEWLANPSEIIYKTDESGVEKKASLSEIREFAVGNTKYIRALVKVDQSSDEMATLSTKRNPEWVERMLLLKVLSEGKATLYHFFAHGMERFFYSTEGNDSIRQLVYKKYLVSQSLAGSNNAFHGQLAIDVTCGRVNPNYRKVKYDTHSLEKYFSDYNACNGIVVEKVRKSGDFNLSITPGIDFTQFESAHASGAQVKPYQDEKSIRVGLEAEFILPFNKNKWALLVEPTYQSYETKSPFPVKYVSIEVPAGARHYFYLTPSARLFLNAQVVLDLPITMDIWYSKHGENYGRKGPQASLAGGGGFKYSRFSIEGRYYDSKSRLDKSAGWWMVQRKFALILGYRLF